MNCSGLSQYNAYEAARQWTVHDWPAFFAGWGNALAQIGDFGITASNPQQGLNDMATGNTLSAQYTRWMHHLGVNTSGRDYQSGTTTALLLIMIASMVAGPEADGGVAAEDAASITVAVNPALETRVGTTDFADAAATCGGMSFTGSTKVLLARGAAIPIRLLKVGVKVLAANTKTGRTQAETVTAVQIHHDTDLYDLTLDTPHGAALIDTTTSHWFWDQSTGRWTEAADLLPGSKLETPDGTAVAVADGSTPRVASGWMWDLTVSDYHDFYIATARADVLVHNCGPDEESPNPYVKGLPQQEPPRSTWTAGTSEPDMSGPQLPNTDQPTPQTPMQKFIYTIAQLARIIHNLGQS